jgi:NADPH:quinone reductase-like Zn-dependent oxidoreductase
MRLVPTLLRPKNSIPGVDYSGTIAALGPTAPKHLNVGLSVFGTLGRGAVFKGQGTMAEFLLASPSNVMIAPLPSSMSKREASTIGIGGLMAVLIMKHGGIRPNNNLRVLVNGASGGIGSLAVQVLRAYGAKEIVAICSARNAQVVKSLGADSIIDYQAHPALHDHLAKTFKDAPFDFILDTIGVQSLYLNSPFYLKESGVYENIGDFENRILLAMWYRFTNMWWPVVLGGTPRRYVTFGGDFEKEAAEELERLVTEGKIKGTVESEFKFEDIIEAIDLVASKRARGRVVVKVGDE